MLIFELGETQITHLTPFWNIHLLVQPKHGDVSSFMKKKKKRSKKGFAASRFEISTERISLAGEKAN